MCNSKRSIKLNLEVFHANGALNPAGVSSLVHLHFARPLMIAEWTIELGVQRRQGLPLGWGSSLRFPATHFDQLFDTEERNTSGIDLETQ